MKSALLCKKRLNKILLRLVFRGIGSSPKSSCRTRRLPSLALKRNFYPFPPRSSSFGSSLWRGSLRPGSLRPGSLRRGGDRSWNRGLRQITELASLGGRCTTATIDRISGNIPSWFPTPWEVPGSATSLISPREVPGSATSSLTPEIGRVGLRMVFTRPFSTPAPTGRSQLMSTKLETSPGLGPLQEYRLGWPGSHRGAEPKRLLASDFAGTRQECRRKHVRSASIGRYTLSNSASKACRSRRTSSSVARMRCGSFRASPPVETLWTARVESSTTSRLSSANWWTAWRFNWRLSFLFSARAMDRRLFFPFRGRESFSLRRERGFPIKKTQKYRNFPKSLKENGRKTKL